MSLLLLILCPFAVLSQDWLGFHGLERQGVGFDPSTPIDWSGQASTLWTAPVQGFGYSTPVVTEDKIYLTTAYETQKGKHLRYALAYLNPILSLLLVTVAVAIVICALAAQDGGQRMSFAKGCRLSVVMSVALLVLAVCVFAETFFSLGSSTVRSWKYGTAAAFISLLMMLLLIPRSKAASILFAFLATFLSVCAYRFLPQRELFLDFSPTGSICTLVVLLPGALGWAACLALLWATAPPESTFRRVTRRWARFVLFCALAALGTIGVVWALRWRMESDLEPMLWNAPDEALSAVGSGPVLGWPFLLISGVLALVAALLGALMVAKRAPLLRRLPLCGATASVLLALGCFLYFGVFPLKREMAHAVVCLDTSNGSILWVREIAYSSTISDLKGVNSHATPTIAVGSAGKMCAYFGSAGLYGLDAKGEVLWKVTDANFDSPYGLGHSPVIADDIVILANDNEKYSHDPSSESHIIAYSLKDGRPLWRQERERSEARSAGFSTPIVRRVKGKKTILMRGWDDLTGYDLYTGEIKWTWPLKHRSSVLVASLVSDDKYIYVLDGGGVRALDLDALSENRDPVAWLVPAPAEKVATPVLVDGLLFLASDKGVAFCVDVNNKRVVWREKLGTRFLSSVVAHGETVVFTDESGKVSIVDRGPAFKLIAQMEMGEKIYATPVPQSDGLLIRGATNLFYVIATQPGGTTLPASE